MCFMSPVPLLSLFFSPAGLLAGPGAPRTLKYARDPLSLSLSTFFLDDTTMQARALSLLHLAVYFDVFVFMQSEEIPEDRVATSTFFLPPAFFFYLNVPEAG